MPLWKSPTARAFRHNLIELMRTGRKKAQALAIDYKVTGLGRKKKKRKKKKAITSNR